MDIVCSGIAVGVGATAVMDLWSLLQKRLFSMPSLNWCMVGRWIGHMPRGHFVNDNISLKPQIPKECTIGWLTHYVTGIAFGIGLFLLQGAEWGRQPTLLPALAFGIATVVFPFFIMQPGLGAGIAASKTPKPNQARARSILTHVVFGLGLYGAAVVLSVFI